MRTLLNLIIIWAILPTCFLSAQTYLGGTLSPTVAVGLFESSQEVVEPFDRIFFPGLHGGFVFETAIGPHLVLESGLIYNLYRQDFSYPCSFNGDCNGNYKFGNHWMEFPLGLRLNILKWRTNDAFSIRGGASLAFLQQSFIRYEEDNPYSVSFYFTDEVAGNRIFGRWMIGMDYRRQLKGNVALGFGPILKIPMNGLFFEESIVVFQIRLLYGTDQGNNKITALY